MQYLLKFPIAVIKNLPSDPQSDQNMFLQFPHHGRLHFLGSRFAYLYHTIMPIGHNNSHEIFTEISHITANILLNRTHMLLFTPSATADIKLVSVHETVQLLLSYILSHHLRLTQIRSSLTVMHVNNYRNSFISYLAAPLN
jgi:hypothetical protein